MASLGTVPAHDGSGGEQLVLPPVKFSSHDPASYNEAAGDEAQFPAIAAPGEASTASAFADNTTANGPQGFSEKGEGEGRRSLTGRRRDASRDSKRSAQAHADNQPRAAGIAAAPGSQKPKKKSGFLSFLNCCASPGSDDLDSSDSAQLAKSPATHTQPTRSRVPQQDQQLQEQKQMQQQQQQPQNTSVTDTSADSKEVIDEKARYEGASNVSANGLGGIASSDTAISNPMAAPETSEKQPAAAQPYLNTAAAAPLLNVQAPTPVTAQQDEDEQLISDRTPEQAQRDTDIEMTDAGPSIPLSTAEVASVPETETHDSQLQKSADSTHRVDLPPPPPLAERQAQTSNSVAVAQAQDPSVAFSPEPSRKWLLPSIKSDMSGRKCLVLDLDETLVHSSFKILHQADFTIPVEIEGQYHNVYVIKRPGVDTFLKRVGEIYEVVVFTASVSKYGDPLLDQLDISGSVHHRLFRESCYNHQGNYVKDLSQVGRPLEETIIIDNSPTSYIFHPQHAVPISSWFSDAHDNELLDLIPVLEDLAGPQVRDVSLVLDVAL